MNIIIDGIVIAGVAGLDLQQQIEDFGAYSDVRMGGGASRMHQRWRKRRTRIEGSGWVPDGLANFDARILHTIACGVPLGITPTGGGNVATLPAARRTETAFAPYAYALVGLDHVPTALAIDVDSATATVVTGATSYTISYFPILTCRVPDGIVRSGSAQDGTLRWSLDGREA